MCFITQVCKIYINNVFPTSIPDISLDQFSEGEIIFLECRFAYEDINYAEYGNVDLLMKI